MAVGDTQIIFPGTAAAGELRAVSTSSGSPTTIHTAGAGTQFVDVLTAMFINSGSTSALLTFSDGTTTAAVDIQPGNGFEVLIDRKRMTNGLALTVYASASANVAMDVLVDRIQVA